MKENDILPEGTLLQGKYEIQQLLRTGGMGYIYLARNKNLYDRLCVVKQLRERIKSEAHRQKLEEEALRMSKLSHPHIAMIIDRFIESGYSYLVEELIKGKTLSEVFKERQDRLEEDEVVSWAISICDVIAYIHQEGIIHRDISPDNIMLTPEGSIKFIDFGTSREWRYIAAGQTAGMGKFGYTPPEQWLGKPDEGSDIFAVGATLYYLLTGFLPLSASLLIGNGAQTEDYYPRFPPIREHNPRISARLEAILEKALQLDIHNRYSSAIEMQADLGRLSQEVTRHISDSEGITLPLDQQQVERRLSKASDRWRTAASAMQHPATLVPLTICILAAIYFSLLSPIFGGGWAPIPIMAVSATAAVLPFLYHYFKEHSARLREPGTERDNEMPGGEG